MTNLEARLTLSVFDYDRGSEDDLVGTACRRDPGLDTREGGHCVCAWVLGMTCVRVCQCKDLLCSAVRNPWRGQLILFRRDLQAAT